MLNIINKKLLNDKSGYTKWIIFASVFVLVYITYYFHFFRFGLYEDDYWFVGVPGNTNLEGLIAFIKRNFTEHNAGHGRLIGTSFPFVLTFITYKIGGLYFTYFCGLIIVAVNGYLFYTFLKKTYLHKLAIIGTLIYVLYPADTTKALLVHAYQLQVSMMFLMFALHLFADRKVVWSYIIASLCLLTYENAFLPFLAAPLLVQQEWNKSLLIRLIRHVFIFFVLMAVILFIRKLIGEQRVGEIELADFVMKTILSVFIGPAVALSSFIKSPVIALQHISQTYPFIIVGFFALLVFLTLTLSKDIFMSNGDSNSSKGILARLNIAKSDTDFILKVAAIGLFVMMAAYVFSITHYPPKALTGRNTSVHFGASIGAALFLGAFAYLFFILFRKVNFALPALIFSAYMSLLIGYGKVIQDDFAQSWKDQTVFWENVTSLVPDLEDGTVILVQDEEPIPNRYILTHSWTDAMVLDLMYEFPGEWEFTPKMARYETTRFDTVIKQKDSAFYFNPVFPFVFDFRDTVYLEPENVVFIEENGNRFIRREDSLLVNGDVLYLKPKAENNQVFDRESLAKYIIGEE